MSKGDIQYVADTILLEKILTIEEGITKQAGLVDIFRGLASSIQQSVADRVEKEGIAGTLATYLVPAMLGRIWAPLGILASVASSFGFSVGSLMNQMLDSLKPKLESDGKVSMDEVNSAGKSAAESILGETFSSDDMFYDLRRVEANGQLTRLIRTSQWKSTYKASPWLSGSGGILGRIFGSVGRLRGKWLIAGIIIWFVKTVLLGAGLIEGTKALTEAVGLKKEKPGAGEKGRETEQSEQGETEQAVFKVNLPSQMHNTLKPSGQGLQYHANDGNNIWIVPLLNENVAQTLISWAVSIYPELKDSEKQISQSSPFINLVSLMNKGIHPESPGYMIVPQGLHTRKNIVDIFASDEFKKGQNES